MEADRGQSRELVECGVRQQLSGYLESTPEQRDHERLAAHLDTCSSCRAYARTLGHTVALLHQLPRVEMPAAARAQLLGLVAAGTRQRGGGQADLVRVP